MVLIVCFFESYVAWFLFGQKIFLWWFIIHCICHGSSCVESGEFQSFFIMWKIFVGVNTSVLAGANSSSSLQYIKPFLICFWRVFYGLESIALIMYCKLLLRNIPWNFSTQCRISTGEKKNQLNDRCWIDFLQLAEKTSPSYEPKYIIKSRFLFSSIFTIRVFQI